MREIFRLLVALFQSAARSRTDVVVETLTYVTVLLARQRVIRDWAQRREGREIPIRRRCARRNYDSRHGGARPHRLHRGQQENANYA
jgi:hypothetical protein